MNEIRKNQLLEHLIAAMTAGLDHKGAEYRLPETIAVEYGRLTYNQAVKDAITIIGASKLGYQGTDLIDAIQGLHITQREQRTCPPCYGDCNEGRNCPARKT